MRVTILGPFEVRSDAGDCLPVAGARLRDLITRLALVGGKPVSTAALAEAVWGDQPPADLANALQTLVSRARRALGGPAAIEQSPAGYRLAVTPDDVDALRFEHLAADGHVEEALALWRGAALEDAGDFAAPYARRLEELKLDATMTWLARELEAGRVAAHVAGLEALAAESPLNEKVTALLMRALAGTGRQAAALAVYAALRARLADELGIDPGPQLQAIHLEVLRGKVEASDGEARHGAGHGGTARGSRRASLPMPLTSFIGREDEVGRVGKALAAYRLVTLVGPGGAGKTRLAREVAAKVAAGGAVGRRIAAGAGSVAVAGVTNGGSTDADPAVGAGELAPDGVWMAELASVTDAADVPQAVLGSIGLRESRIMLDGTQRVTTRDAQTRLLDGLADARALLVLDNCEHLIDACAHLADTLLAHSPGLRIVATSREPLGITGESLLVVPPLAQDPAVRLFADRAAAVRPGFTLDAENLPLVTDIVHRLDGLPLAIELAAARLRTLSLAEISRRLDDRFRLLTGGSRTALPRHRTLRAVVEWSWDLLSPAEQLLAERFSVFPAGATAEAAAEVCARPGGLADDGLDDKLAGEDIDELLSSLADKSLLQPVDGGTRLRMLETIREYGAEKLAERAVRGTSELQVVRRRHAVYYADLMNEATPRLLTRDQLAWLGAVEADRDNILAALRYWSDVQDAGRAIALALSVATVAFILGDNADITELIALTVTLPGEVDPDMRTVADALHMVTLAIGAQDHARPVEDYGYPDLADRIEALNFDSFPLAALLRPGYAMFTQDIERARRYIDEALASQDEWVVAAMWLVSALLAENNGDMATVRSASAQALARFRALGERWGLSSALRMVANIRVLDGDLDGAAEAFSESGHMLNEMGSRDDETHMRMQLANIAARRGDLTAARELYQAALEAADSDQMGMDVPVASAGYAMFEVTVGNAELARPLNAAAEQGLARLSPGHPARHHMVAVVAASGLMLALADGDLSLARERAETMHQAARASEDMPLLATTGGVVACLAHALGQPERAARMLGACAAVRGEEDPTDLMVTQFGSRFLAALGPDAYGRAYRAGTELSRTEALALLDPATF
ncbi:MAG TPA: BTAD domain-containing putative transcriptional regulator [Trebonia sp.]|nr:BTAD domain-containing putative transcriptional regulator [Trebonia sp.]